MSATRTLVPTWSARALGRLRDSLSCPVCGRDALVAQRCLRCSADFSAIGGELWDASQAAAAALEARQAVLDRVTFAPAARRMPAAAPASPRTSPPRTGPSATVQSVLAVAGAGLVAIAAIVFTYLNPDLTDRGARSVVIAATTLVFLFGTHVLVRRGLRFSAEAVGALGLVFLGLDVHAFAELAPAGPWVFAALGTVVTGGTMAVLGSALRLRTWVWTSLVALAFVPAMLGAGTTALSGVFGWFGSAVAAFVLIDVAARIAPRFGALRAERVTLTVVQLAAVMISGVQALAVGNLPGIPYGTVLGVLSAAVAALALFSTRHPGARLWSLIAGSAGVFAAVVLVIALTSPAAWTLAVLPATAAAGLVVVAAVLPLPRTAHRGFVTGGAVAAVAIAAVPSTAMAAYLLLMTVLDRYALSDAMAIEAVALVVGLAALAVGLILFAWLRRQADAAPPTRWLGDLGLWYATLTAMTLACLPPLPVGARIAVAMAVATVFAAGAGALVATGLRAVRVAARLPLVVGAHALVVLAGLLSWRDDALVVGTGIAIVAVAVVLARTVPAAARFVHTGLGYAYALVVFATALHLGDVEPIALVCLTTSLGAVVAVVATFVRAVPPRSWQAVLVVTSVPFAIGVAQVVVERSGWTALSTGLIFLLALALLVTRRAGLGILIRVLAAATLVPSFAVVLVCLGAQLLPMSGSPIVLPAIAVVVALVLAGSELVRDALAPRIGERAAALTRLAVEASTLVTAAIAVLLALVREAAGLGTAFLVLVILGVGASAAAGWARRRYGWWLAGAAFTGALWCVWGMAGVTLLEPYLLPPALAAALVGAILTARGSRGMPLYGAGLALAVVPLLGALAVSGPPTRALGLIAASWVLLVVGLLLGRPLRSVPVLGARLRALRTATLAVAIVAGAAGAVQGVRFGLGTDAAPDVVPLVVLCLALGLAGAVPAALAAARLSREAGRLTRWLSAPALLYVGAATWTAIDRDWVAIWSMWGLMLAYLATLVAISARTRRHRTSLPPVWFVFGLAFVTAVVAWSPRDLRVEWFSLPLGLLLLAAGAVHLRTPETPGRPSLTAWPATWHGSWALLGPGIVVTFSASIAATFTDPVTWRAILVMVLALAAIIVGAGRRLAAPFLIGIVVLPVENALAFLVQIGRGIEAMPWWITLAVVGAVLLVIAVTYERRADAGIAARLRDLA